MAEAATKRPAADPDDPAASLPDGAPDGAKKAARGKEVTDREENGALDFLLGATKALEYDVPTFIDTNDGRQRLTFHIKQLDGQAILDLEKKHTQGSGPFAVLDDIPFNAALVAEATVYIEDEAGKKVEPESSEFRGDVPSPHEAMRIRFKHQPGILEGLSGQIRSISGYAGDRVGAAERAMVNAAGNS